MMIDIPDDEAAARREWAMQFNTPADCRKIHDKAVADDRLAAAADWSFRIGLLEWSPPRAFKVGDVVRSKVHRTIDRTVRGIDDDYISFGVGWDWVPAANYVLVKAVDDAE